MTVTHGLPADVLEHAGATRRFRLLGVGLAVVLLVAGLFRYVQTRAVPELRLDGSQAVYLVVSGAAPNDLRLQVPFRLLDRGGEPVTVLAASVSGSLLRTGPLAAEVPAHGGAQLALEQAVVCRDQGPPVVPGAGARMRLRVRTAHGQRDVRLPLPPEPRRSVVIELNRRCGWVPVEEALRVEEGPPRRVGDRVLVGLTLSSRSARAVRVTGLVAPAVVDARTVGGALPLQLPAPAGPRPLVAGAATQTSVLLSLALTTGACASGARPLPSGTLVELTVDQGAGTASGVLHPPDLTGALAALRCGPASTG